jgi:hypothetical protein
MGVKSKYTVGRLKYYSGAVDDESVTQSTAASTAISNYGVTRLMGGAASIIWNIDAPVLGAKKTIVIANSTRIHIVKTAPATINNSSCNYLSVALSSKAEARGVAFDLYGASTILWYLASGVNQSSNTGLKISLTTTP